MYDPVKDGVAKDVQSVVHATVAPPPALRGVVHTYWELRTEATLAEDFTLHALPDACVNLLCNLQDPRVAGVTQLQTSHVTLELGRSFHFAGIQLFPGVWQGDPTVDHYVGEPYGGELPLVEVGRAAAAAADLDARAEVFTAFVEALLAEGLVVPDPVTSAILGAVDRIRSVGDMAQAAHLSPRQLQRVLRRTTGFTPHDLLKVLRVQQSFRQDHTLQFADQSHFTHAFSAVVGHPPGRFARTYDV